MKSCPYVTGNSFLAMGGESIEFYYIHINGVIRIVESQEVLKTLRPLTSVEGTALHRAWRVAPEQLTEQESHTALLQHEHLSPGICMSLPLLED